FGLSGGLGHIALTLERNQLTGCEITGAMVVPFFDEPVDIRVDIKPSGDFSVTLLGADAGGIELSKEELVALTVKSLTLAKEGGGGLVPVTGTLQPLVMSSSGLDWPRFELTDLSIDTKGHFRIREAWLDLKKPATLDLFGFALELDRIGLGYEDPTSG